MEMNVGLLKKMIADLPDDTPVFVCCEGYSNYNFREGRPWNDTDTFAIVHDGKLFIIDDKFVDAGNGETI